MQEEKNRGKTEYIVYIAVIFIICLIPFAGMLWHPTTQAIGNGTLTPAPALTREDGSFNTEVLSDLQDYINDHFAYRPELVSANAILKGKVFSLSSVDSVIYGKNDTLYYEATLDDFQHRDPSSERMLFNIAHNVALMQEYTELLGKKFVFTIAPNKNSLYGENMPGRYQITVNEESDAGRLGPYLEAEGVNYVDLFALFGQQEENLYCLRDSHWNNKGAVLVYNTLLDRAGISHARYDDVQPEIVAYSGDLNQMLYPVWGETEPDYLYLREEDKTYSFTEEDITAESNLAVTFNPEGTGNLLMYRDSFGNTLLPYFAQHYENAAFSKVVPYPMTDLVTYAPDTVIVEKVERHLQTLGTVPPVMSAPVRVLPEDAVYTEAAENGSSFLETSVNGSYLQLTGAVDESLLTTGSRIYAEVTDSAANQNVYEAFDIKITSGTSTDYGFLLYLPMLNIEGNGIYVRILGETQEGWCVLWEGTAVF